MKQSVLSFSLSEETLRKEIEEKDQQLKVYAHHCRKLEENVADLRTIIDRKDEINLENRARLSEQMLQLARKERSDARKKLTKSQFQVGYVITTPTVSDELGESWIWGQKYKDAIQQNKLYRQYMKKDRRSNDATVSIGPAATTSSINTAIRREDMILREKLEDLEREKIVLLKEIRRITDEDRSRFSGIEVLANRYVMMSLLGRGGFSEVWKAYDVKRCMYVAIKFHQVGADWGEERKRNYIRHSKRECEVHMTLDHPKVIQLFDVEILDDNTFVSIMEFSEGCDLDTYLKRNGFLREAEAKIILLQLIQGLRYLAELEERIIHYDLKPANILFSSVLFNCWDIKITDFGLCKIMNKNNVSMNRSADRSYRVYGQKAPTREYMGVDDFSSMHAVETEDTEIELTSQGTGTYWYLPPECFQSPLSATGVSGGANLMYRSKDVGPADSKPARISAKVDVWALGVVFYQMLFGRRPFGEGLTQKQIWNNNVMGKIREIGIASSKSGKTDTDESALNYVVFPTRPSVSVEAKEFIKSCLEVKTSERPDIFQLAKHPYVINQLQSLGSPDGAPRSKKSSSGTNTKPDQTPKAIDGVKTEQKTEQSTSSERLSQESKVVQAKTDTTLSDEKNIATSEQQKAYPIETPIETDKVEETIEKDTRQKVSPEKDAPTQTPQQTAGKKRRKRIDPTLRSAAEDCVHNTAKKDADALNSTEPNITFDEYEQLLKTL